MSYLQGGPSPSAASVLPLPTFVLPESERPSIVVLGGSRRRSAATALVDIIHAIIHAVIRRDISLATFPNGYVLTHPYCSVVYTL